MIRTSRLSPEIIGASLSKPQRMVVFMGQTVSENLRSESRNPPTDSAVVRLTVAKNLRCKSGNPLTGSVVMCSTI